MCVYYIYNMHATGPVAKLPSEMDGRNTHMYVCVCVYIIYTHRDRHNAHLPICVCVLHVCVCGGVSIIIIVYLSIYRIDR